VLCSSTYLSTIYTHVAVICPLTTSLITQSVPDPKRFHAIGMLAMFTRWISRIDLHSCFTVVMTARRPQYLFIWYSIRHTEYRHLSDVGGLISRMPRVGNTTISHRMHHAQTLGELLLLYIHAHAHIYTQYILYYAYIETGGNDMIR